MTWHNLFITEYGMAPFGITIDDWHNKGGNRKHVSTYAMQTKIWLTNDKTVPRKRTVCLHAVGLYSITDKTLTLLANST